MRLMSIVFFEIFKDDVWIVMYQPSKLSSFKLCEETTRYSTLRPLLRGRPHIIHCLFVENTYSLLRLFGIAKISSEGLRNREVRAHRVVMMISWKLGFSFTCCGGSWTSPESSTDGLLECSLFQTILFLIMVTLIFLLWLWEQFKVCYIFHLILCSI